MTLNREIKTPTVANYHSQIQLGYIDGNIVSLSENFFTCIECHKVKTITKLVKEGKLQCGDKIKLIIVKG